MKLRRQELDVVQQQLPTQSKQKEVRVVKSMIHFFDPIDLFKTVLSSAEFRANFHTGMACSVDQPSELYHSFAWASSVKACSEDAQDTNLDATPKDHSQEQSDDAVPDQDTNLDEAGMTGAHVFSYPVGTISNGKDVTATMETAVNGVMKITYRCHADGFDVRAGDFMWSAEALAFKRAFGLQGGGNGGLDEAMAQAFMNIMEHGEQA